MTEEADENLLAGQSMVILRLEDNDRISDPIYLLRYLYTTRRRKIPERNGGRFRDSIRPGQGCGQSSRANSIARTAGQGSRTSRSNRWRPSQKRMNSWKQARILNEKAFRV